LPEPAIPANLTGTYQRSGISDAPIWENMT
jgi:hypothetical protein